MRVKTPHFLRTSLETFPMQKCKEMHNAREAYRCIFVVCRGFAPAGATKGRSPSGGFPIALWKPSAPTYKLVAFPTLVGRGGSVSRRDHNQAARNRAHLAWAHKPGRKVKPIPSYSSGEGVWGRGASLREAASPPESPPKPSLEEGARGRGLLYREAPSLAYSILFVLTGFQRP